MPRGQVPETLPGRSQEPVLTALIQAKEAYKLAQHCSIKALGQDLRPLDPSQPVGVSPPRGHPSLSALCRLGASGLADTCPGNWHSHRKSSRPSETLCNVGGVGVWGLEATAKVSSKPGAKATEKGV